MKKTYKNWLKLITFFLISFFAFGGIALSIIRTQRRIITPNVKTKHVDRPVDGIAYNNGMNYFLIKSKDISGNELLALYPKKSLSDFTLSLYLSDDNNYYKEWKQVFVKNETQLSRISLKNRCSNSNILIEVPNNVVILRFSTAALKKTVPKTIKILLFIVAFLCSVALTYVFSIIENREFYKPADNKKGGKAQRRIDILLFLRLIVIVFGGSVTTSLLAKYFFKVDLNSKKVGLIVVAFFIIYLCVQKKILFRKRDIGIFTLCIFIMSSIWSLGEPITLGICYDDVIHYRNIIGLSNLATSGVPYSDDIISSDQFYYPAATQHWNYSEATNSELTPMLNTLDSNGYIITSKQKTHITATSLGYAEFILMYIILRGWGVPWGLRFILTRFAGTLFFTVFFGLSIRKIKNGRLTACMIALLPVLIFISGNYTYDTFIITLCMYSFCSFIKTCEKRTEKISCKDNATIFLPLILACLVKPVYIFLGMVYLFFPKTSGRKHLFRKQIWWLIASFAICLGINIIFYMPSLISTSGDTRWHSDVSSLGQINYIRNHFTQTIKVFGKFLLKYFNPLSREGGYGCTNLFANAGSSPLPGIVMPIVIICSFVDGFYNSHKEMQIEARIAMCCAYIFSALASCLALYLSISSVGSQTIEGVQPRYLFPLLFPLLYSITGWNFNLSFRRKSLMSQEIFVRISLMFMSVFNILNYSILIMSKY